MFVATLFEFLESRGIARREIVDRLGAHRSAVWMWAQGQRGIARAYQEPFKAIVAQAMQEMNPDGQHESAGEYELWQMVMRWEHEVADKSGEVTARARKAASILAELAHQDLTKCTAEESNRYMEATIEVRRALRVNNTRKGYRLPADPFFQGYAFPDPSQTALDRFEELWGWHERDEV
jgi:transcriptional regulator with XRE-family HTH domain